MKQFPSGQIQSSVMVANCIIDYSSKTCKAVFAVATLVEGYFKKNFLHFSHGKKISDFHSSVYS